VYHLIRDPATALILPGFPASLHDIPEILVAGHRKEIFFQRLSHAPGDLELFGEQHKPRSGDHRGSVRLPHTTGRSPACKPE